MNQYYNKQQAKGKSKKRIMKRYNRIENYMHNASALVVKICLHHGINEIIIGHNKHWKNEMKMGRKGNQKFAFIPHSNLISKLKYKAERANIKVIEIEESYTSKASFLDGDELPIYNPDVEVGYKFSGRRISRGLYKTSDGTLLNADVNGAANIMRKCKGNEILNNLRFRRSLGARPVRVNPLRWANAITSVRLNQPSKEIDNCLFNF